METTETTENTRPHHWSLTLLGIEIYALASQAEHAKRLIAEHLDEEERGFGEGE